MSYPARAEGLVNMVNFTFFRNQLVVPNTCLKSYSSTWAISIKLEYLKLYNCATYLEICPLVYWVECSPIAWETGVQSPVESYQRLKKWYLISSCLKLSIIRYASRVKWSNPRKGERPSLHLGVVATEKGTFGSPSSTVSNFSTYLGIYTYNLV